MEKLQRGAIIVMGIREQEEELFGELKKMNPDIIADGIVDEKYYLDSRFKIVFVLKEVNGGKGWSLTEFVKAGGRPATWDNVARWTEAILNIEHEKDWNYWSQGNEERRRAVLKRIGVVNLKKTSGSYVSDSREIYNAAHGNENIIKRQIDIYAPDIIICGGTGDAFVDTYFSDGEIRWERTSRGIYYVRADKFVVISYSHPAARVSDCLLHYGLIDAVREIYGIRIDK